MIQRSFVNDPSFSPAWFLVQPVTPVYVYCSVFENASHTVLQTSPNRASRTFVLLLFHQIPEGSQGLHGEGSSREGREGKSRKIERRWTEDGEKLDEKVVAAGKGFSLSLSLSPV